MSIYDKKFIIEEVLDNHTQRRSEVFGYRVGRGCSFVTVGEGLPLIVRYPDGKQFISTPVCKAVIDNEAVIVKTKNRTYFFKEIPNV